jgi:hypothetical protein
MSYRKFTLKTFCETFSIPASAVDLFSPNIPYVQPSDHLQFDISEGLRLPLTTEKAKSEYLIVPILREVRRHNNNNFTIFSGYNLTVDKKRNLTGFCDFVLTHSTLPFEIDKPMFCIVEAKNEDIEGGVGQCAAEMLAARIFNERDGTNVHTIYGCVTNAVEWLFLRLENDTLLIDTRRYALANLPELLGALQTVIDFYKTE